MRFSIEFSSLQLNIPSLLVLDISANQPYFLIVFLNPLLQLLLIFLYLLLWKYQLLFFVFLQYLASQFIILSRTFIIIKYNIFNWFLFYLFSAFIVFIFFHFLRVCINPISLYYFILFVCSHIILNSFIFFTGLCHRLEATYSCIFQRSSLLLFFILLWLFIFLVLFNF